MNSKTINKNLNGLKIALCARLPKREGWAKDDTDFAMQNFVITFCQQTFQNGGRVIHETPSRFMPIIVGQARRHAGLTNEKPVVLYISVTELMEIDSEYLKDYSKFVDLRIVEQAENLPHLLQRHMLNDADCLIAVGGRHDDQRMDLEISLASTCNIPAFIFGGTGGITDRYVSNSKKENQFFSYLNDKPSSKNNDNPLNFNSVGKQNIERKRLLLDYEYYAPTYFETIRNLPVETRVKFTSWLKGNFWSIPELENIFSGIYHNDAAIVIQVLKSINVLIILDKQYWTKYTHIFEQLKTYYTTINWQNIILNKVDLPIQAKIVLLNITTNNDPTMSDCLWMLVYDYYSDIDDRVIAIIDTFKGDMKKNIPKTINAVVGIFITVINKSGFRFTGHENILEQLNLGREPLLT